MPHDIVAVVAAQLSILVTTRFTCEYYTVLRLEASACNNSHHEDTVDIPEHDRSLSISVTFSGWEKAPRSVKASAFKLMGPNLRSSHFIKIPAIKSQSCAPLTFVWIRQSHPEGHQDLERSVPVYPSGSLSDSIPWET